MEHGLRERRRLRFKAAQQKEYPEAQQSGRNNLVLPAERHYLVDSKHGVDTNAGIPSRQDAVRDKGGQRAYRAHRGD